LTSRFGLLLVDALIKYFWSFKVHCGKEYVEKGNILNQSQVEQSTNNKAKVEVKRRKMVDGQERSMVQEFTQSTHGRGHIVMINNFFTLLLLYVDLYDVGSQLTLFVWSKSKYLNLC